MNQKSDRVMYTSNRRKNNSKSGFGFGLVAIYFLIMMLNSVSKEAVAIIILVFVAIAGAYIGIKLGKKRKNSASTEKKSYTREYCSTCSDEFVYNNVQNEHNGYFAEENIVRDRQRRLNQLDGFLKNGLIDKAEYMVLRSHYEK